MEITHTDIVEGLKRLGLSNGDIVLTHSSLSAFGYVIGGGDTVVNAIREVIGGEGTLVAPTFHSYFRGTEHEVYDIKNTPSWMGRISEIIRLLPDALRSREAVHPLAAAGPLAKDIIDRRNVTSWGRDSSFGRLLELNAWILLMGVTYNSCTMFHLVEEYLEVPYREWRDHTGYVIEGGIKELKTFKMLTRKEGYHNDFNRMGLKMEDVGLVQKAVVGESILRMFRSKDLYDVSLEAMEKDPEALLVKNDEPTKIKAKVGEACRV